MVKSIGSAIFDVVTKFSVCVFNLPETDEHIPIKRLMNVDEVKYICQDHRKENKVVSASVRQKLDGVCMCVCC